MHTIRQLIFLLIFLFPVPSYSQDFSKLIIHYHRYEQDYEGWGLHVWGNALALEPSTTWATPLMPYERNPFGVSFEIPLKPQASRVSFILHLGEEKNTPEDVNVILSRHGYEVWILQDDPTIYSSRPPLESDNQEPEPEPEPPPASSPTPPPDRVQPSEPGPLSLLEQQLRQAQEQILTFQGEKEVLEKELEELRIIAEQEAQEGEVFKLSPLQWFGLLSALALSFLFLVFALVTNWRKGQKLSYQKQKLKELNQKLTEETEERLIQLSYMDELTGLMNRSGLNQFLNRAMEKAQRYSRNLAILFLDLDGFKPINDSLGHEAGDFTLKTVSSRFKETLRASDLVCRMGGDEFVFLIEDVPDTRHLASIAQKILQAASKPFLFETKEVSVSASLGISTYPDDGQDSATLLRLADEAMYQAKKKGKNRFQYFSEKLNKISVARLEMEKLLVQAQKDGEFYLEYLPIFHPGDQRILGAEALLRWKSPKLGKVSPLDFVPLAEENGLILSMGRWVLSQALSQAKDWVKINGDFVLSVNVSPKQLTPNFEQEVIDSLRISGFPKENLILELTESCSIADCSPLNSVLTRLKEIGLKLALDDFGTGTFTVSMLKKHPIDILKIDNTFLADVPKIKNACSLFQGLYEVGQSLGMKIMVEGIETKDQLQFVQSTPCLMAQGFVFSKPLAAQDLEKLLKA